MRALEVQLDATPASVPEARRSLDAISDRVSPATLEDLRLLVSELVTNSIRHAGLAPDQAIALHVDLVDGRVRVEVCDDGTGFAPTAPTVRTQADDQASGWGLFLVREVSDRWGVSTDGVTRVWFELVDRPV
jgi:anti-sigma regulatory factor (Ser/Thr protein kinase)